MPDISLWKKKRCSHLRAKKENKSKSKNAMIVESFSDCQKCVCINQISAKQFYESAAREIKGIQKVWKLRGQIAYLRFRTKLGLLRTRLRGKRD